MLNKKAMMKFFKDKQVEAPKGGVTKRKTAESTDTVVSSVASESTQGQGPIPKKPKRVLEPYLQDALDRTGNVVVPESALNLSSDKGDSPVRETRAEGSAVGQGSGLSEPEEGSGLSLDLGSSSTDSTYSEVFL